MQHVNFVSGTDVLHLFLGLLVLLLLIMRGRRNCCNAGFFSEDFSCWLSIMIADLFMFHCEVFKTMYANMLAQFVRKMQPIYIQLILCFCSHNMTACDASCTVQINIKRAFELVI